MAHDADIQATTPTSETPNNVKDDPEAELNLEGEAENVADAADAGEGGKLKMIVSLLKRCLGVKDLAAMRLSLPASLLEPIPNLEYWLYLDRPDLFVALNDSDDQLERMLAVLRFTFTKDLKFIRGKVVKPYNSVLGEHFRAHWDVLPVVPPPDPRDPPVHREHTTSPVPSTNGSKVFGKGPKDESVASFRSGASTKRAASLLNFAAAKATPLPASPRPEEAVEGHLAAEVSRLSLGEGGGGGGSVESGRDSGSLAHSGADETVRVAFLTEQISHHPPISAYYAACPMRGVSLAGVDQITARVSGTGVRIAPGSGNKGLFVRLEREGAEGRRDDEQYQVTHPVAMVNGLLRGNFYVTVCESTIITCSGIDGEEEGRERLRAIIEYKEEPWIGSPRFVVEGVVHTYREGEKAHEAWTKVKHVPAHLAAAYFDGSWRTKVRWRRANAPASSGASTSSGSSSTKATNNTTDEGTLIDLTPLLVVPKRVRPLAAQHAYESRRLWEGVTRRLRAREYGEATRAKQAIEQRQRDKAAERKRRGEEFVSTFFEKDISSGVPVLTAEGRRALEEELQTTEGES